MNKSEFTLDAGVVAQFTHALEDENATNEGLVVHGAQSFRGAHGAQSFHRTDS